MTKPKIQPFCRATIVNLGYYDGMRVFLRSVTDREKALFSYNNLFCLKWNSENNSFNKPIKELKVKIK